MQVCCYGNVPDWTKDASVNYKGLEELPITIRITRTATATLLEKYVNEEYPKKKFIEYTVLGEFPNQKALQPLIKIPHNSFARMLQQARNYFDEVSKQTAKEEEDESPDMHGQEGTFDYPISSIERDVTANDLLLSSPLKMTTSLFGLHTHQGAGNSFLFAPKPNHPKTIVIEIT